jgi:hypothetical protein
MNFQAYVKNLKNIDSKTAFLVSLLFLFVAYLTYNASNKKFEKTKNEYLEYQVVGEKYKQIQSNTQNKGKILEKLTLILSNLNIKNALLKETNKTISLEIPKIEAKKLSELLNIILNDKLNIKQLEIKKESLTLQIEVI